MKVSIARVAWSFIALFAISTTFPIVAAFIPIDAVPQALGFLDVAVAAVTVVVGFTLEGRARALVADAERALAWRVIRLGSTAILLMLALFLVAPTALSWDVLLIGLGWRAWLAIWVLPALVAGLRWRENLNRAGRG